MNTFTPQQPQESDMITRNASLAVLAIFFACAAPAPAAPLTGQVVQVVDGDTIIVRSAGGVTHRVRVSGIDAPQRGQAYSAQAKRRVESLTLGRSVTVDPVGTDGDGSIAGKVRVNGRDLGLPLVNEGAAWHDSRRQSKQTPSERSAYSKAQREAQDRRSGLWAKDHPTDPRLLRERRHGMHQGDR